MKNRCTAGRQLPRNWVTRASWNRLVTLSTQNIAQVNMEWLNGSQWFPVVVIPYLTMFQKLLVQINVVTPIELQKKCKNKIFVCKYSCESCIHSKIFGFEKKFQFDWKWKMSLLQYLCLSSGKLSWNTQITWKKTLNPLMAGGNKKIAHT